MCIGVDFCILLLLAHGALLYDSSTAGETEIPADTMH